MRTSLRIDRHFQSFRNQKLALFADRVLRKSRENLYVACPADVLDNLARALQGLNRVLSDDNLKRKARTAAIRDAEAPVVRALSMVADFIERTIVCKSDIYTTGFRPMTESRKPETVAASQ
jgi:2-phospho-L-lactate guanylyltransferase (CobY/MobA/RfbA family)